MDGRWAVIFLLAGGILTIFLYAVREREISAATNALVALALVAVPQGLTVVLRSTGSPDLALGPELPLWIAVAGLLHSIGMLGPYETIWWWDHLTHTVSAALVAALIYAGAIVALRAGNGADPSVILLATITVTLTFAVGVLWELIELVARDVGERLDVEPVLVHYGWIDTGLDLVFDVAGALIVLVLDFRTFVPVAQQFADATGPVIKVSGVFVIVASAALTLIVSHRLNPGD